ncbi:MAG: DUF190 domain-containing protein [Bacteroidetes bacterium]|nr:DUF190 domain-containing protein [Bacteroidota bacterium]
MEKMKEARRLRIYASSTDKVEHTLLSEFLVNLARNQGMAGATVTKGILGYGASSVIHSYKLWEITEKVPVIIEIIDAIDKINTFREEILPILESLQNGCLVTIDAIEIILYKPGKKKQS